MSSGNNSKESYSLCYVSLELSQKMAKILGKTLDQLKYQLLSKYLVSELKYPSIKMRVI